MKFGSMYLEKSLKPSRLKVTVKDVSRKVSFLQKKLKFEAIAFRGFSGASIAFPVSFKTGIPLLMVRKGTTDSHGSMVEGDDDIEVSRYLILDDFISSGETIAATIRTLDSERNKRNMFNADCVGILLYSQLECGLNTRTSYCYTHGSNCCGYSNCQKIPVYSL